MQILRFEINTPVEVALKVDGGRDVDGRYGPQVLYTLADDRLMYLEPKAARRIAALRIKAGEPFTICKRETGSGQKRGIEWEITRVERVDALGGPQLVRASGPGVVGIISTRPPVERAPGNVEERTNGKIETAELFPMNRSAQPNELLLESKLRRSIPGVARIENALKSAIAAVAGAEQFGREIGYEVKFAPEDIRALALSALQSASPERRDAA